MSWEDLVRTRKHVAGLGWAMLPLGLVLAIMSAWVAGLLVGAVALGLGGVYLLSASHLLQQQANLRAALDMKRMALDNRPGDVVTLAAGDEVDVFGHCIIRAENYTKIRIIR